MYAAALLVHSWLRWLVLGLLLGALAQSGKRWRSGRDWDIEDEILARVTMMVFFVQAALGLILLVELSPLTAPALRDMAVTMKTPALRRLVVEHPTGMVLAFLAAGAARLRTRNPEGGPRRHRDWCLGLGVALVLLALTIPWPGTAGGRPLLRLPGS